MPAQRGAHSLRAHLRCLLVGRRWLDGFGSPPGL
jgi:hypothetical protein